MNTTLSGDTEYNEFGEPMTAGEIARASRPAAVVASRGGPTPRMRPLWGLTMHVDQIARGHELARTRTKSQLIAQCEAAGIEGGHPLSTWSKQELGMAAAQAELRVVA